MAANQTVTVLEADGVTTTDVEILGTARQAAANSKSVAMSTEDKAVLDAINSNSSRLTSSATNIAPGSALATTSFIVGSRYNSTPPTFTNGQEGALQIDAAGRLLINGVLAAGSALIGKVDVQFAGTAPDLGSGTGGTKTQRVILDTASQNANGQATMENSAPVVLASDQSVIQTAPQPLATGGLSVFRSLDLDETEEEVKATAGCLYKIRATNRTTSVRYLKLYNATAANTTVGTTTPIDTIPLPANASDYTVLTESFGGLGLTFGTALSMAVTTGFADADTGAPGANDVIVSAYYK